MRINKTTTGVLLVLVLAVLNILFFAWTDAETRGAVEWMSYGFTMFAFVVACISVFRIPRGNEVYNLTTSYLPVSYFGIQTILGAVAIYYAMVMRKATEVTHTITNTVNESVGKIVDKTQDVLPDSIQGISVDSIGSAIEETVQSSTEVVHQQSSFLAEHYTVIVLSVYLLVLVIFAFNFVMHATANKATADSLAKQADELAFSQTNSQLLQRLLPQVKEPAAKKAVNSLFETIRYGASHTTPEGKQLQGEVTEGIARLITLINNADWNAVKELAGDLNTKAKQIH